MKKTKIKKEDKVIVIAGKEKGKIGKIMHLYPKLGKVLIRNVNNQKKHVRPTKDMPQGGIIEKEGKLNISNVMCYCDKCNKGVKLGIKRLPDGTRMRFCRSCDTEL